ncbi:hypothetical protein CT0881 [Chlorobaculum tepidum TLS]|uniref:Uncharacterized protein n=1 Tax=Chlorobaculum tepidum (strain ATCC 49652 / DSM 12025 / NBRC 103806 / TLS) TaxID=194439 RepID=Q8KE12_CHLTE|nr:hypothetical protein CT0881 [Chlorobaculum tepidum TLS]
MRVADDRNELEAVREFVNRTLDGVALAAAVGDRIVANAEWAGQVAQNVEERAAKNRAGFVQKRRCLMTVKEKEYLAFVAQRQRFSQGGSELVVVVIEQTVIVVAEQLPEEAVAIESKQQLIQPVPCSGDGIEIEFEQLLDIAVQHKAESTSKVPLAQHRFEQLGVVPEFIVAPAIPKMQIAEHHHPRGAINPDRFRGMQKPFKIGIARHVPPAG